MNNRISKFSKMFLQAYVVSALVGTAHAQQRYVKFLGDKAVEPAMPCENAMAYYNTVTSKVRVCEAAAWEDDVSGGGGGMTIGDPVVGGSATALLFVDGSVNLGQDALDLFYASDTLSVRNVDILADGSVGGNFTIGNAAGDSVTSNAGVWSFPNDTTVALGGGINGINFDSNTWSVDALNNRVGVGRADPVSLLTVGASDGVSGSDSNKLLYVGENTSSTRAMRFENNLVTWDLVASTDGTGYMGTFNNAPLALTQNNIARVYVNGTNVGIGPDTTPDNMLDVQGNANVEGNFTMGDASGDAVTSNAASWSFPNTTTVSLNNVVNALNFDSNTWSVDALNNRVGVNTAAPVYDLQVNSTLVAGANFGVTSTNAAAPASILTLNGSAYNLMTTYGTTFAGSEAGYVYAGSARWYARPNNGSAAGMFINQVSGSPLVFANNDTSAGLVERLTFYANGTGAVFNEQGNSYDLRVEGDTDTDLWFVDASTDRVGVSTNAPQATLDVSGDVILGGLSGTNTVTTIGGFTSNIPDNTVSALSVVQGGVEYIEVDSTNTAELVTLGDATAGVKIGNPKLQFNFTTTPPTCAADSDFGITAYSKSGGNTLSLCLCTKLSGAYTITILGTGDCS